MLTSNKEFEEEIGTNLFEDAVLHWVIAQSIRENRPQLSLKQGKKSKKNYKVSIKPLKDRCCFVQCVHEPPAEPAVDLQNFGLISHGMSILF
jgi:hypothetical protein